ncbi:hypothetical protein Tco_1353013 [Tanacetum coccineum]
MTKKKTPEQSLKLKGIEMLFDAAMLKTNTRKEMKANLRDLRSKHQSSGSSEGAGITLEVPDESQAKSIDTNEGAGITPEVLDVYKVASLIQDLKEDWVSEEDDVILTSDDKRTESKKETTKSGKNDDDMSIDLDVTDDEEDEHVDDETQRDEYVHKDEYVHEDDEYVHEEEEHVHDYVEEELNDAEISKIVKGDKELTDPNKSEAEKIKEAKGDEEQVDNTLARVDQAKEASTQDNQTVTLIFVTQKGKPELSPTSSSLSVSSGFDTEINSMLDIQIQHEVSNVQSSSLLTVPVSVIPKPTVLTPIPEIITEAHATTISPLNPVPTSFTSMIQQSTPIPTPTTTTKAPSSTTVLLVSETLSAIQRRVSELEKEVKELKEIKQVDHSTTIHASIKSQVLAVVNEYLGSSMKYALQKPKSTGKFVQADETVFEGADTDMPLNQGDETGNTDEQPDVEAIIKDDWFKKLARPPTPDPEWNTRKSVDDAPEQSWLNDLANAEKPPLTFDDLMSTHIYFSTFAMNRLKISKLTKVDLNYPEGNRCPYDLSKPLPLQECQGHLTVPIDFFLKNDLEYLRKGSTDRKYMASTTKKKAVKYKIEGIEDTVPKLCSPIKVAYDKYAALGQARCSRDLLLGYTTRQKFYGYVGQSSFNRGRL